MLPSDLFYFALSRGLGDAHLWLKEHSAHQKHQETIREALLAACLYNDVYDPQCETPRHEWLLSLVDLTSEPDYYHSKIIRALAEQHDDFWDNYQRVDLCLCLAERGNQAAHHALYDFFRRFPHRNHFLAADQLLQLDGLSYLPTIVRCIGQQLIATNHKDDVWDDGDFMRNTFELFGEENVCDCLQQLAAYDAAIDAYWQQCESYLNHEFNDNKSPQAPSIFKPQALISMIESDPRETVLSDYRRQAHQLNQADLLQIAQALIHESRRWLIERYLALLSTQTLEHDFSETLIHYLITGLQQRNHETHRRLIINVLAQYQSSSLRELALSLLQKAKPNEKPNDKVLGLRLMINHYENADAALINTQLHQILSQDDDDALHQACHAVIDIFERHPDATLLDNMVFITMIAPSSLDRYSALKALLAHPAFAQHDDYQATVQALAFDCDEAIRDLAHELSS